MTKRTVLLIIGGAVLVGLGAYAAFGSHAPTKHPLSSPAPSHHSSSTHSARSQHHKTSPKPTPTPPVLPTIGTGPGNVTMSYEAATHNPPPPVAIETEVVPWVKGVTWAIEPMAVGHTLWFGEQNRPQGLWTWIPSILPGALSKQLPLPIYQALAWAYDLHVGQPGPMLPGTIAWSAITGKVGEPAGWTMAPILYPNDTMIGLTVWEPSYTGVFSGYYGVETEWNAQNASTGTQALGMLEASTQTMAQIARQTPSQG